MLIILIFVNVFLAYISLKTLIPQKKTIAIVESEKTAIIMSMFLPDYTWLATGGKQNLKLQLMQTLKDYKIVIFP